MSRRSKSRLVLNLVLFCRNVNFFYISLFLKFPNLVFKDKIKKGVNMSVEFFRSMSIQSLLNPSENAQETEETKNFTKAKSDQPIFFQNAAAVSLEESEHSQYTYSVTAHYFAEIVARTTIHDQYMLQKIQETFNRFSKPFYAPKADLEFRVLFAILKCFNNKTDKNYYSGVIRRNIISNYKTNKSFNKLYTNELIELFCDSRGPQHKAYLRNLLSVRIKNKII